MTIREEIIREFKEWLEDNDYMIDTDKVINEMKSEGCTTEEIDTIIEFIEDHEYEEELKHLEELEEIEQNMKTWEAETRYMNREYWEMVA